MNSFASVPTEDTLGNGQDTLLGRANSMLACTEDWAREPDTLSVSFFASDSNVTLEISTMSTELDAFANEHLLSLTVPYEQTSEGKRDCSTQSSLRPGATRAGERVLSNKEHALSATEHVVSEAKEVSSKKTGEGRRSCSTQSNLRWLGDDIICSACVRPPRLGPPCSEGLLARCGASGAASDASEGTCGTRDDMHTKSEWSRSLARSSPPAPHAAGASRMADAQSQTCTWAKDIGYCMCDQAQTPQRGLFDGVWSLQELAEDCALKGLQRRRLPRSCGFSFLRIAGKKISDSYGEVHTITFSNDGFHHVNRMFLVLHDDTTLQLLRPADGYVMSYSRIGDIL